MKQASPRQETPFSNKVRHEPLTTHSLQIKVYHLPTVLTITDTLKGVLFPPLLRNNSDGGYKNVRQSATSVIISSYRD